MGDLVLSLDEGRLLPARAALQREQFNTAHYYQGPTASYLLAALQALEGYEGSQAERAAMRTTAAYCLLEGGGWAKKSTLQGLTEAKRAVEDSEASGNQSVLAASNSHASSPTAIARSSRSLPKAKPLA